MPVAVALSGVGDGLKDGDQLARSPLGGGGACVTGSLVIPPAAPLALEAVAVGFLNAVAHGAVISTVAGVVVPSHLLPDRDVNGSAFDDHVEQPLSEVLLITNDSELVPELSVTVSDKSNMPETPVGLILNIT